jgi:hypothetical protein
MVPLVGLLSVQTSVCVQISSFEAYCRNTNITYFYKNLTFRYALKLFSHICVKLDMKSCSSFFLDQIWICKLSKAI